MKDLINFMLGLPKCKKGGRCNMDIEIDYSLKSGKFFEKSNEYKCSKCGNKTTNCGKI